MKEWGKGTSNKGWAFELSDAGGQVLTSDSDSFDWIASSSAGNISLKERCEIRADSQAKQYAAAVTTFYAACEMATPQIPDSGTLDIAFSMLGIGVTVNVTKNQGLCNNIKGAQSEAAEAARAATVDDCINHPGKYLPSLYPPEPDIITAIVVPAGYDPMVSALVLAGMANDCPLTRKEEIVVDMPDGRECSVLVAYRCFPNFAKNTCECKDSELANDSYVCY